MIPPASLVESPGPRHPRGSPRRDPIVAQAAGRPGADPADSAGSAHTFPKLAAGEPRGQLGRGAPSSLAPHPPWLRWGVGEGHAGWPL